MTGFPAVAAQAVPSDGITPTAPTTTGYAWYVATALCVANIFAFLDRHLMALVSEPLRHGMNVSDVQLGLLQGTGFALLYCFAAIPLGWVADFANRRKLILAGLTVWSVATAGAAFCNSFGALFFTRMFVGIGEASLLPAAMSLLAALFDKARLGRGIAIYGSGALIGHGAAFIGGGAVLSWLTLRGGLAVPGLRSFEPWQALFLIAGISGLSAILLVMTIREPQRTTPVSPDWRARFRAFAQAARYIGGNRRAYGAQIGMSIACTTIGYVIAAWGVSVLVRAHGLTVLQGGAIMGIVTIIVGPLGNLLGGWMTDRLVVRAVRGATLLVPGGALVGILVAAPLFCLAPTLTQAIIGFTLLQFACMIPMAPLFGGIQMLTPDRYRGMAASFAMLIYSLVALGLGPPLVGLVTEHVTGGPQSLPLGLLLTITGFAAAGILIAGTGRGAFERGRAVADAAQGITDRAPAAA